MDENLLFVYSRYLLQTIFSWSEVKISIVFLKVLKTFIVCLSNSVLNPLRTIYLTVWGVKQCEVESSFYYFMCVSAHIWGFPDGLVIICCKVKDTGNKGSIIGSERSPGGGHGNPLQYSCLENPWTEEPS